MQVERYGTGDRAFLCLHGWSGNHATFAPLEKYLPTGVSLWCPDIPALDSMAGITDELESLARSMPGTLRIVGNCSGAVHGLLLAQRMEAERIVMIDAFAYWPAYFRLFLAPGWGRYAYLTAFANPVGRALANFSLARHRTESSNLTEGFSRVDHGATYRQLQMLGGVGTAAQFSGLRTPVEILYGERSFAAVRRSAAMWNEIFPLATRRELKGAGHLPIIEATAQLSRMLFEEKLCTVQ